MTSRRFIFRDKLLFMSTVQLLAKIALAFPETTEAPHFEKTSFRVKGKIFATYDSSRKRVCVKLSMIDQDVFSRIDKKLIYPVDNKWGNSGWTFIELAKTKRELLNDIFIAAYCHVAPKKLAVQVRAQTEEL